MKSENNYLGSGQIIAMWKNNELGLWVWTMPVLSSFKDQALNNFHAQMSEVYFVGLIALDCEKLAQTPRFALGCEKL